MCAIFVGVDAFVKNKFQKNYGVLLTFSPAACDTICSFLRDTGSSVEDYDAIFTGDLGLVGAELLKELALKEGVRLAENYNDFGIMMFDIDNQDVHAGGSGCGCSATLMASYVLEQFKKGNLKNVLYCATGALLSPTSVLQGGTIPGICHLVNIKN